MRTNGPSVSAKIVMYDALPNGMGDGYVLDATGAAIAVDQVLVMFPNDVPLHCFADPLPGFGTGFLLKKATHVVLGQLAGRKTKIKGQGAVAVTTWSPARQLCLVFDRADWDTGAEACLHAGLDWLKKMLNKPQAMLGKRDNVRLPLAARRGGSGDDTVLAQYRFGDIGARRMKSLLAGFAARPGTQRQMATWGMPAADCVTHTKFISGTSFPTPKPAQTAPFEQDFASVLTTGMTVYGQHVLKHGEALFQNMNPNVPSLFPATAGLRTAVQGATNQCLMFAPSAVQAILDHPSLAQALGNAARLQDGTWFKQFSSAAIALAFLNGEEAVVPKLMYRFQTNPVQSTPWADWMADKTMLRQVLRSLACDSAVQDIDTHWGAGAALALGQDIADRLRRAVPQVTAPLTPQSLVMGRA